MNCGAVAYVMLTPKSKRSKTETIETLQLEQYTRGEIRGGFLGGSKGAEKPQRVFFGICGYLGFGDDWSSPWSSLFLNIFVCPSLIPYS